MDGEGMTGKPFPPVFATNRPEKGESVADEINRLLRGLREQLKIAPSIAIATAYLNAQGFELIAEELEKEEADAGPSEPAASTGSAEGEKR